EAVATGRRALERGFRTIPAVAPGGHRAAGEDLEAVAGHVVKVLEIELEAVAALEVAAQGAHFVDGMVERAVEVLVEVELDGLEVQAAKAPAMRARKELELAGLALHAALPH